MQFEVLNLVPSPSYPTMTIAKLMKIIKKKTQSKVVLDFEQDRLLSHDRLLHHQQQECCGAVSDEMGCTKKKLTGKYIY